MIFVTQRKVEEDAPAAEPEPEAEEAEADTPKPKKKKKKSLAAAEVSQGNQLAIQCLIFCHFLLYSSVFIACFFGFLDFIWILHHCLRLLALLENDDAKMYLLLENDYIKVSGQSSSEESLCKSFHPTIIDSLWYHRAGCKLRRTLENRIRYGLGLTDTLASYCIQKRPMCWSRIGPCQD